MGTQTRRDQLNRHGIRLPLHLTQVGSPFAISVWLDNDGNMRIDNLGPFKPGAARRLARWILEVFGEASVTNGKEG